jgi:hypothetical protein
MAMFCRAQRSLHNNRFLSIPETKQFPTTAHSPMTYNIKAFHERFTQAGNEAYFANLTTLKSKIISNQ